MAVRLLKLELIFDVIALHCVPKSSTPTHGDNFVNF